MHNSAVARHSWCVRAFTTAFCVHLIGARSRLDICHGNVRTSFRIILATRGQVSFDRVREWILSLLCRSISREMIQIVSCVEDRFFFFYSLLFSFSCCPWEASNTRMVDLRNRIRLLLVECIVKRITIFYFY